MSSRPVVWLAIVATLATASVAAPLSVTVNLDDLTCVQPTERSGSNNRDEVYLEVAAVRSTGVPTKRRLPVSRFDDYYEFWAGTRGSQRGFTNRDQVPQGVPQLWEGELADGETVVVTVRVLEQDNKQLPLIKALLLGGLDTAEQLATEAFTHRPGSPPAVPGKVITDLYDRVGEVFAALPKKAKDDLIGAFAVTIVNTGSGAPLVSWAPLAQLGPTRSDQPMRATWAAEGTGDARYQLDASVDAHAGLAPPTAPLRYLGVETDRCDAEALRVVRDGGDATLRKGDSAVVAPSFDQGRHFRWYCGDSEEHSRCRKRAATQLRVMRAREGRVVRWGCFGP